jgi:hypothetical protein
MSADLLLMGRRPAPPPTPTRSPGSSPGRPEAAGCERCAVNDATAWLMMPRVCALRLLGTGKVGIVKIRRRRTA